MQQYDKNIREKLHGHAVTPPPSVWSEIESNLPVSESRSNRWMWFVGAIASLLIVVGLFWINGGINPASDSILETHNSPTHHASTSQSVTSTSNSEVNNNELDQDIKEVSTNSDIDKKLNTQKTTLKSELTEVNKTTTKIAESGLNQAEERHKNQAIVYSSDLKKTATTSNHNILSKNENSSLNNTRVDNRTILADSKSNTSSEQQNEIFGEPSQLYPSTLRAGQRSDGDVTSALRKYSRPELTILLTPEVKSVTPAKTDWIGKKRARRMKSPCTYRYDQTCYDFSGPTGESHFYLDILAGPDIYNRTLTAKSTNSELTDYVAVRDASETSELSWSALARASLVTQSGFAVRTGFLYEQVHERFEASRRVTMITFDTISGQPLNDTISGINTVTIYNKLKYLELPFMLGYEYHQDRFMLGLNAGAALGLSFTQRGKILNPADDIVSITSDDNNRFPVYSGQAKVNLIGSISLGYKLTPRMQLIVEPNFRYRLGSVTLQSYPLDQEYFSYGVWTGLRFRL